MSLLAMQRGFHGHLVDGPEGISGWVEAGVPGLDVYHNAYRVQLSDCLAGTFEHTLAWLGGEAFAVAAQTYIASNPPSGWTLGGYGDAFPRALEALYPMDPEVGELAGLEWALSRAFEEADAEPLPVEAIASTDWDSACLAFLPGMCFAPARTNAGAIWSALAAGEAPPAAELLPEAGAMLIWRQGFTPCFRTIERLEHDAIVWAMRGRSFAEICLKLVEDKGPEPGTALAGALLGQWFAEGLIRGTSPEERTVR
ncbi:MAG: DNA-binding domain-containing protein [Allosphingosinicella sp.]